MISISIASYSQAQNEKSGAIGISIPIIWNNSEATFYSLGNRKTPSGKATSYGLNINYYRQVYKKIYGRIGIGYFKQSFNIVRPFEFDDPTNLLFATKSYNYKSFHWLIGIGYKLIISKKTLVNGYLTYNGFNSFKQAYTPAYLSNSSFQTSQINRKSISLGSMINVNLGLERNISKKFSIGLDALLPIYTRWNYDEIFYKYDYSNDTQQIARNKFSIGAAILCYYHF